MKLPSACLLLALSSLTHGQDVCRAMENYAKKANAVLPSSIDQSTEITQVRVHCPGKTLTYDKRLLIPHNALLVGAQERQQFAHTQLHCKQQGLAKKLKWTAVDKVYDLKNEYVFTLTTSPEDCS